MGPKLRAPELVSASDAPLCLAGQRDGKFFSEQDSGHGGNLRFCLAELHLELWTSLPARLE